MPAGFKGKKHSLSTIQKLKNRPKECYKKPKAELVETLEKCMYGCNKIAKYRFANGNYCCEASFNSCTAKRKKFSDLTDHKERAAKSLDTRKEKGITKFSRIKAIETMKANGTIQSIREKMQEHWKNTPHQNNLRCPLIPFKNTTLLYQGTFEYNFLELLEKSHNLEWVINNVKRGPAIWYIDPIDNVKRLYISDFIIDNTIYEIKSKWTWNKRGKDINLKKRNKAKLESCINEGYNVKLILDGKEFDAWTLD